jgi:catechol 2,3-dioxygenase-like lactoylglutathione lyase family enzyme
MSESLIGPVDFVGFPTKDLDAAVAFYGDTLGLRRSVYLPERNYASPSATTRNSRPTT